MRGFLLEALHLPVVSRSRRLPYSQSTFTCGLTLAGGATLGVLGSKTSLDVVRDLLVSC